MPRNLSPLACRFVAFAAALSLLTLAQCIDSGSKTLDIPHKVGSLKGHLCSIDIDFAPVSRFTSHASPHFPHFQLPNCIAGGAACKTVQTAADERLSTRTLACAPAHGADICHRFSAVESSIDVVLHEALAAIQPNQHIDTAQLTAIRQQWAKFRDGFWDTWSPNDVPGLEGLPKCRQQSLIVSSGHQLRSFLGVVYAWTNSPKRLEFWSLEHLISHEHINTLIRYQADILVTLLNVFVASFIRKRLYMATGWALFAVFRLVCRLVRMSTWPARATFARLCWLLSVSRRICTKTEPVSPQRLTTLPIPPSSTQAFPLKQTAPRRYYIVMSEQSPLHVRSNEIGKVGQEKDVFFYTHYGELR